MTLPGKIYLNKGHKRSHTESSQGLSGVSIVYKPTTEENIALEAIRRMGNTIDTNIALEFLRGPQFGDQGLAISSSASERSLPQSAVAILKLWFLVHQADPYPTKEEKEKLMRETGLSKVQLKNWFSNIRKRHWHPIRTGSRRPRCHVEYVLLYGTPGKQTEVQITESHTEKKPRFS